VTSENPRPARRTTKGRSRRKITARLAYRLLLSAG
jgi:hypothetical protein